MTDAFSKTSDKVASKFQNTSIYFSGKCQKEWLPFAELNTLQGASESQREQDTCEVRLWSRLAAQGRGTMCAPTLRPISRLMIAQSWRTERIAA